MESIFQLFNRTIQNVDIRHKSMCGGSKRIKQKKTYKKKKRKRT